ncbi:hypothetical protein ONZ51_g6605 [Trametes cubensis]|uniref:F-box domain-containing protein n=1 Tax=Trametes cubensis TaxID=1111947 RepID=A0AAD7TU83_9APHY|nr:hypothetical protein ONZ51_g6605 [Trametes cubensis]
MTGFAPQSSSFTFTFNPQGDQAGSSSSVNASVASRNGGARMQPDLQWRISPPVNNQPFEPIFAPVSGPSQEEGGNAGSCSTSVQIQVSSSQDGYQQVKGIKHTRQTSILASLNFDVFDQIISWLPDNSLASLGATCRYFADTTFEPLSKRSNSVFRTEKAVASFRRFLRIDSPIPRGQFVRELHFGRELQFIYYGHNFPFLFDAILQIVKVCRQLRRLRIDFDLHPAEESFKYFSRIISMTPALEELIIYPPFDLGRRALTELFRPRLRKLTLIAQVRNRPRLHEFPLELLPVTLEELDLSAIMHTWTMNSICAFPRMRSLKIPYPDDPLLMGRLMHAVPGIQHLTITNQINTPGRFRANDSQIKEVLIPSFLLNARTQLQQFWKADSARWPQNLVSISAESASFLYALAVPAQVHHCSVSLCNRFDTLCEPAIPILSAIFGEAMPTSVECKFTARYANPLFTRDYFRFLSSTKSLKRCTITFDYICTREQSETLINTILSVLGGAFSLTHLLLNDPAGSALFDEALLDNTVSEEDECEKASCTLALRIASAAPALQWLCINAHACILPPQAWRITRIAKAAEDQIDSPQSGGVTLQKVSEDEARRTFGTNFGREAAMV